MTRSCRWTPLGPIGLVTRPAEPGKRITSGRVTAIAVHPTNSDIIYVGTAGGGVWRTTNRGRVWRPLLYRAESLAIGAIAIDPSNPDRVFVGTGEGNDTPIMAFLGVGLLITQDAGSTWSHVDLGVERTTSIVVSPSGHRVFVASTNGTWEHRREDDPAETFAFATWKSVNDKWTSDLVYDSVADRLYLAVRGDGVYVRAANANTVVLGRTGVANQDLPATDAIGSESRLALAWIPTDRQTILAVYTHHAASEQRIYGIYRSDNSGTTWTPVVAPLTDPEKDTDGIFEDRQAQYNLLFARNPSHPTDLFLGMNQIWRSKNLGTSFDPALSQPAAREDESEES